MSPVPVAGSAPLRPTAGPAPTTAPVVVTVLSVHQPSGRIPWANGNNATRNTRPFKGGRP